MFLKSWVEKLKELPKLDVVTKATLVSMIISRWVVTTDWRFLVPLQILAVAGLLVPRLNLNKWFWWIVTVIVSLKTIVYWWSQDNHLFVFNFWCLTLAMALSIKHGEKIVENNAKLILGVCFLFATLWKVLLSPDYMSGDYFHFTFLTDLRFQEEALMLAGVGAGTIRQNIYKVGAVRSKLNTSAVLSGHKAMRLGAKLVTWWTAIIEGLLAITFLSPLSSLLGRSRNIVLLAFSWTTYLSAPVLTFGWTLNVLGLAQTTKKERAAKAFYLITLLLLIFYKGVPLMGAISKFLASIFWI